MKIENLNNINHQIYYEISLIINKKLYEEKEINYETYQKVEIELLKKSEIEIEYGY